MKRNVAGQYIGVQVINVADGADFTGTLSCKITKDNGTATASTNTPAVKTNGYFELALTQAETDAAHVAFTFYGTGAVTQTIQDYPSFPQTGDGYALLNAGTATTVAGSLSAQAQTDVKSAMTSQGYTTARAGYLDVLNGLVAAIWNSLTSGMTTADSIGKKLADWIVGTIDTYTGNTKQTGDAYSIVNDGNYGNSNLKTVINSGFTAGAKEATLTTKIPTALSFTGANVNAESKVTAAPTDMASQSTLHTVDQGVNTINQVLDDMSASINLMLNTMPTDSSIKTAIWNSTIEFYDELGVKQAAKAYTMLQAIFSTIKQRLKEQA